MRKLFWKQENQHGFAGRKVTVRSRRDRESKGHKNGEGLIFCPATVSTLKKFAVYRRRLTALCRSKIISESGKKMPETIFEGKRKV